MYEVPVSCVAIVSTELTHRGHPGPVLESATPDRYGLEEFGQGLVLREIGLEEGESSSDRAPSRHGKHTAGYAAPIAGSCLGKNASMLGLRLLTKAMSTARRIGWGGVLEEVRKLKPDVRVFMRPVLSLAGQPTSTYRN